MKKFDFSNSIIDIVIEEIGRANSYIKIAVFQLHNDGIIDTLIGKINDGVSVEIFTLPYNSINEDVRQSVTERLEELKNAGATIHFCKWNVGDPERTSTAVNVWYSFHGKFMVTDRAAISLSANLVNRPEIDAILIFDNEEDKIQEFNGKFDELKELFIIENNGYDGNIRQKILDTHNPRAEEVFEAPRSIDRTLHGRNWILQYPPDLCSTDVEIEEKLYLIPFDGRGRNLFMKIIDEAEEFVYISVETFTDPDFPNFLKKIKLKGIELRVLSGYNTMDFKDRVIKFTKELIAIGIKLYTPPEELHAKFVITDKLVALGSINLNNMNLGIKKTGDFWRANTETLMICRDSEIINNAKQKYLQIFDSSNQIIEKIAKKNKTIAGKLFREVFNMSSSSDAKEFLAKISLEKDIKKEKEIYDVIIEALRLKTERNLNRITKELLEEAVNNLN